MSDSPGRSRITGSGGPTAGPLRRSAADLNPPDQPRSDDIRRGSEATAACHSATADATWNGPVTNGAGKIGLESGVWHGRYATPATPDATDPEELLAAAHAGRFAMTVAHVLSSA